MLQRGFYISKFLFTSFTTGLLYFLFEIFDSCWHHGWFPFILISGVTPGILLVLINKAITTDDATLILNHDIYKHCHVVYFHFVLIGSSKRQNNNPLLWFKNLLNEIPIKVICRFFLIRSLSQLNINLECLLSSTLCWKLFYIFTGVSQLKWWYSTIFYDPILDPLRIKSTSCFNFKIWLWTSKCDSRLKYILHDYSHTKSVFPSNSSLLSF